MAGGAIISDNRKQYPGNMTFRVFVTCFLAATGGLIFGYDLGISGGVTSMDPFLKEFFPSVYKRETSVRPSDNQYCKFNDETLTFFTSSLYLAGLVSSAVSSTVTRTMGRKFTMFLGGTLFLAGAICNAAAKYLWMLYVGRILLGFGIGCVNQSVPIYVSETAPAKYRGAMNIMFQFAITIGILIANLLNYVFAKIEGGWGWRLSLGGAVVPALIIMLGSFFLPDTPNSLLERGKDKEAREQLKKLRGIDNVEEEFNDLKAASDVSKMASNAWGNIFKRKYRPQLTFAVAIPFFQQFTGMNVFVFYAPVLFKTMGFGNSASLMSAVITGIVNCAATVIAIVVADKAGRRTLFIEGGLQMLVCQLFITLAIAWKFGVSGHPGILPGWYSKSLVALMCIYIAGYAWSWGPLGWLVPSEIFPLEIRSAAQSINVGVNMVCTFIIAQIFTFILCEFKFGLFIFFMVFVIIMTIFIYKRFPETKGVPIEDMQQVWKDHPHWSKYFKDENEPGTIAGDQA